ncbi:MAG: cell division protein FtsZ [Methanospirillum sp.]|nr:cell division protein FtsZ [Methanospirillum sp.]
MRDLVTEEDVRDRHPIVIVGCGGAGITTINRLHHLQAPRARTIAVDTDRQHLDMVQADSRILIARSLTRGLGAGGSPDIGRRAAEMARSTLEAVLEDAELCFLTVGLGGGTGTGAAPVVAQIAKDRGATVIVVVGYPLNKERESLARAEEGVAALYRVTGSVVVLDNNRLQPRNQVRTHGQAFTAMDQLMAETIKAISEAISEWSLINIDIDDLRAVMSRDGAAVMLVGDTDRGSGARGAARACLSHPLFDIDYHGATGALFHITGGSDLTVQAAEEVVRELMYELDPMADLLWGARAEPGFEGCVRVMAIMTGIRSARFPRTTR